MELVPIIVIFAIGAVGLCLMLAAIVIVGRQGGWQQAMKSDARGHWPAPRLLMFIGALLGWAFGLGFFVPGVVPWWDYSSPYAAWGLGVGFGLLIGFGLHNIYRKVSLARREHQSGVDRAPQA
jgi:hypothetical protein